MDEYSTIRASRLAHRGIISTCLFLAVFLFWLALSTPNTVALLPAVFGLIICAVAAALIRRPFSLELTDVGLLMRTPFGDLFYAWEGIEYFSLRRADPITTQVVFKLKPAAKPQGLHRFFRPPGFDGALFPYFEIGNAKLLAIMRERHLRGRVTLLL